MVRPDKCLLNDPHTVRCREASVKREKKEYRHSFPTLFFPVPQRGREDYLCLEVTSHPGEIRALRWLKEEDWESWPQVLWISQCGKKKKSWAVSLDWKRLKTENRIHGLESPFGLPPGSSVGSQEPLEEAWAAATFIHPLLLGDTLTNARNFQFPHTLQADAAFRVWPWPSPGLPLPVK